MFHRNEMMMFYVMTNPRINHFNTSSFCLWARKESTKHLHICAFKVSCKCLISCVICPLLAATLFLKRILLLAHLHIQGKMLYNCWK